MERFVNRIFYHHGIIGWLLWPLSWVYRLIIAGRKIFLIRFCQTTFEIPVIVVGNITLGGVGKTPLVLALVEAFKTKGIRVGIVSRGYGAKIAIFPHEVSIDDTATSVGDEPLLMARHAACPVVIAPDRVAAVRYLIDKHYCQVVISDDGLQHYKMGRALEIAVIDGTRGLGNGLCLPAGPLREPASRLKTVDFCIVNGGSWPDAYRLDLEPGDAVNLCTKETRPCHQLTTPLYAIAGIGNPRRFFDLLKQLGLTFHPVEFPDHYQYTADSLASYQGNLLMTEKDAVKCQSFAKHHWYFLPVKARIAPQFWQAFWTHQHLQGFFKNDD